MYATLRLGDQVTYRGRTFVLKGFTPMSIDPPRVYLEDDWTGELVDVPAHELEAGLVASTVESFA